MDGFVFVSQLVGGLMVLLPFVLRERYKTGKWFFDIQQDSALVPGQFSSVIFMGLLVLAFGAVIAFLLRELAVGWVIVAYANLIAFRLVAAAPCPTN